MAGSRLDAPVVGYGTADFSEDMAYRYRLTREFADRPGFTVNFVGLNPSTADALTDDPTIRRCLGFARRWGAGRIVMTNLFALRSTDPAALLTAADPVGPENDAHLLKAADESYLIVACWGVGGAFLGRGDRVGRFLDRPRLGPGLQCLGTTKDGHPRHPLYLRGDAELEGFPS